MQGLHVKLKPLAARNDLMRVMQLHRDGGRGRGGGALHTKLFQLRLLLHVCPILDFRSQMFDITLKRGPYSDFGSNVKSEKSGSACAHLLSRPCGSLSSSCCCFCFCSTNSCTRILWLTTPLLLWLLGVQPSVL